MTFYEPVTGAGRTMALGDEPLRTVVVTADGVHLATAGFDGTLHTDNPAGLHPRPGKRARRRGAP